MRLPRRVLTHGDHRLPERFWSKVDLAPNGSCWLWMASIDDKGYGTFWWNGAVRKAHRTAYVTLAAEVPDGLVLDHLCRVRRCVNPAHLEPVTVGENNRRGLKPYGLRTECKRGHDITDPANVYVSPDGRRSRCRICARAYYLAHAAEYEERRRARRAGQS